MRQRMRLCMQKSSTRAKHGHRSSVTAGSDPKTFGQRNGVQRGSLPAVVCFARVHSFCPLLLILLVLFDLLGFRSENSSETSTESRFPSVLHLRFRFPTLSRRQVRFEKSRLAVDQLGAERHLTFPSELAKLFDNHVCRDLATIEWLVETLDSRVSISFLCFLEEFDLVDGQVAVKLAFPEIAEMEIPEALHGGIGVCSPWGHGGE